MPKNKAVQKFFKDLARQRKNLVENFIKFILPVFMLFALYALVFQITANSFSSRKLLINVPQQAGASYVLNFLNSNKITPNKYNTKLAIRIAGYDRKLHAGLYQVRPEQSLSEIFAVLQEKKGLSLTSNKRVVIPEGYSFQEIQDLLAEENVVSKSAFVDYIKNLDRKAWWDKYPFLPTGNIKLENKSYFEGYVFPDTYYLAEDSSPNVVLEILLSNFQRQVLPMFEKNNKTKMNLHQMLTLASIVEKEVGVSGEREKVASIYYKRFMIRMHLGSCPTVKYALGQPRKKYLLYKDLTVNSPYNTYRRLDLPPGPICSPGLASFQVMLDPKPTEELYFVAKGDGTHVFSTNLNDHINHQREITGGKIIY